MRAARFCSNSIALLLRYNLCLVFKLNSVLVVCVCNWWPLELLKQQVIRLAPQNKILISMLVVLVCSLVYSFFLFLFLFLVVVVELFHFLRLVFCQRVHKRRLIRAKANKLYVILGSNSSRQRSSSSRLVWCELKQQKKSFLSFFFTRQFDRQLCGSRANSSSSYVISHLLLARRTSIDCLAKRHTNSWTDRQTDGKRST